MANILQDLTYYMAAIKKSISDIKKLKDSTNNPLAKAVARGRIMQGEFMLGGLKEIYKKEERRQSRKGKPRAAKLTGKLIKKFEHF